MKLLFKKPVINKEKKSPPEMSRNVMTDIRYFLLNRPQIKTLVKFENTQEREEYNNRIMQWLGLNVDKYSILNIHRISIDAPPSYIFNELIRWNGDSTIWPNNIANVSTIDENLEQVKILLFGWEQYPFGFKKTFLGLRFIPFFLLNPIRIKSIPDAFDFDNARYLLFRCSGGYPIGIFSMYVRSPILDVDIKDQSQLFFIVGFNFYGKEKISSFKMINIIWENIHNRVTANILNRVKQLSEWRIGKMQEFLWDSLKYDD